MCVCVYLMQVSCSLNFKSPYTEFGMIHNGRDIENWSYKIQEPLQGMIEWVGGGLGRLALSGPPRLASLGLWPSVVTGDELVTNSFRNFQTQSCLLPTVDSNGTEMISVSRVHAAHVKRLWQSLVGHLQFFLVFQLFMVENTSFSARKEFLQKA